MKTKLDFVKELEQGNKLSHRKLTFPEYAEQLLAFQDVVCKAVAREEYHEGMRFDEAQFLMESAARERDLRKNPAVHNGILAMKRLEKEMSITMSGIKAENLVSRTLGFLNRPNTQIFRNVYVTNGQDETELDAIVLTDSGVLILEVKKVKSDLIFAEDGRLIRNSDECYDKTPLGEKMAIKRDLLKASLEKTLSDKGMNIPVFVDSLIVFSAPKGKYIRMDDRYHKERYCFLSSLNAKIENYVGYAFYKPEELSALGEVLAEMKTNVKRFDTELNYDEVRSSLAEALAILENVSSAKETIAFKGNSTAKGANHKNQLCVSESHSTSASSGFGYVVASVLAGVLITGAAAIMKIYNHRNPLILEK